MRHTFPCPPPFSSALSRAQTLRNDWYLILLSRSLTRRSSYKEKLSWWCVRWKGKKRKASLLSLRALFFFWYPRCTINILKSSFYAVPFLCRHVTLYIATEYICQEVGLVISIQLNLSPFERSWCHDTPVMGMSVYNVYRLLLQSHRLALTINSRFSFIKFTFLIKYIYYSDGCDTFQRHCSYRLIKLK